MWLILCKVDYGHNRKEYFKGGVCQDSGISDTDRNKGLSSCPSVSDVISQHRKEVKLCCSPVE